MVSYRFIPVGYAFFSAGWVIDAFSGYVTYREVQPSVSVFRKTTTSLISASLSAGASPGFLLYGPSPKAFVPLFFENGEAFQFDWSEEGLLVGGLFYKAQVSHMKPVQA